MSLNNTFKTCVETNLKLCTNLTHIYSHFQHNNYNNDNSMRLSLLNGIESPVVFKRLRKVFIVYTKQDINCFLKFVRNYGKSLKAIEVIIDRSCDETAIAVLMTGLSQMQALIDLRVVGSRLDDDMMALIPQNLRDIAVSLPNLKAFSLRLYHVNDCIVLNEMKLLFRDYFKGLKRLEMNTELYESLDECKRLTHLTLYSEYNYIKYLINDTFFVNIDKKFPKLQYLSIDYIDINENILNSLSKLRKLKSLSLGKCKHNLSDNCIHSHGFEKSVIKQSCFREPDYELFLFDNQG